MSARRLRCRPDTRTGNRPSFTDAAQPDVAGPLVERFCEALGEHGIHVETGVFGARMEVELVNDGPVTIVLDGRSVTFSGVNLFRFEAGRVAELWNHRDDLGLQEQLGVSVFAGAPPTD